MNVRWPVLSRILQAGMYLTYSAGSVVEHDKAGRPDFILYGNQLWGNPNSSSALQIPKAIFSIN
jgi:hypothetical protein